MKDVEKAVGVPQSAGLYALCSSPNINPMAKYKPVRYDKKGALTLSELRATRFGFGATVPTFTGGNKETSATWEYQRVRAGTDWARLTDYDGYHNRACVPFAFGVSGAIGDGVGLYFYVNSSAASYYSDNGRSAVWDEDYGLSLTELFAGARNASASSYIAVCIHDMTKGDSIMVVTNRRVQDLGTSVETIILYPTQRTISGITYPAVAMLGDTLRSGNSFRFIVGLSNSGPTGGAPYQVLTEVSGITLFSLAISAGIDRKDRILVDTHSIIGLQCSLSLLSATMTYVGMATRSFNGQTLTMMKYTLDAHIMGIITTPSGHWSPEGGRIGVKITVSANGFAGDDDSQGTVQVGTSVSVPDAGQTYYFSPLYHLTGINLYYYQGTGTPEAYVNAMATEAFEEIPFRNSLTINP